MDEPDPKGPAGSGPRPRTGSRTPASRLAISVRSRGTDIAKTGRADPIGRDSRPSGRCPDSGRLPPDGRRLYGHRHDGLAGHREASGRLGCRTESGRLPEHARDVLRGRLHARREGLPDGGLNIAHEAVRRHASGPRRSRAALRLLGRRREVTELTYAELDAETNRSANVLAMLGVHSGDRVFALVGRITELYVAALETLKA